MIQKGKTMIVGRDSRVSGPWVKQMVHGILVSLGYKVVDIGIVPTPTVILSKIPVNLQKGAIYGQKTQC
jgi:phosphomannomutase